MTINGKVVQALRQNKDESYTEGVFVTTAFGGPLFLRGGSISALWTEMPHQGGDELGDETYMVAAGGESFMITPESYEWLATHLEQFSFLMFEDQDGPP